MEHLGIAENTRSSIRDLIRADILESDEQLFRSQSSSSAYLSSPRDPMSPFWNLARLISALIAERFGDYLERSKEMTETVLNFVPAWRHLAVANAVLGRIEAAKAAIERVIWLAPNDTLRSVEKSVPIINRRARQLYLDGLRRAGLPG